jgi:hypothetical protein
VESCPEQWPSSVELSELWMWGAARGYPTALPDENADGAPRYEYATNHAAAIDRSKELSVNATPGLERDKCCARHDAIEHILSTRKIVCADDRLEWPFLPRSNGHGRRHSAGIPSRRKREGAGVLGSPTGHPFFIVDGDQTKAPRWHRISAQADWRGAKHQGPPQGEIDTLRRSCPDPSGALAGSLGSRLHDALFLEAAQRRSEPLVVGFVCGPRHSVQNGQFPDQGRPLVGSGTYTSRRSMPEGTESRPTEAAAGGGQSSRFQRQRQEQ